MISATYNSAFLMELEILSRLNIATTLSSRKRGHGSTENKKEVPSPIAPTAPSDGTPVNTRLLSPFSSRMC